MEKRTNFDVGSFAHDPDLHHRQRHSAAPQDHSKHGITPIIRATGHDIPSQNYRHAQNTTNPVHNYRHAQNRPNPPFPQSHAQTLSFPTPQEIEETKRTMQRRIRLNVGGREFETKFGTLLKCDFFRLRLPTKNPGSEPVFVFTDFIDRCPDLFAQILQYLRTNEITLTSHNRTTLQSEAQYYGIKSLIKKIERVPIDGGYVIRGNLHPLEVPLLEYTDLPTQVNISCYNNVNIKVQGTKWLETGRHYLRFVFVPSEPYLRYSLRVGSEGFFKNTYSVERPDLKLSIANEEPVIEKQRSERFQEERSKAKANSQKSQRLSSGAYTRGILQTHGTVSLLMCIDIESRYFAAYNTELQCSAFVRDLNSVPGMMWRPFWVVEADHNGPFKLHVDIFKIPPQQFEKMFRRQPGFT